MQANIPAAGSKNADAYFNFSKGALSSARDVLALCLLILWQYLFSPLMFDDTEIDLSGSLRSRSRERTKATPYRTQPLFRAQF